jgi:ADP-ribose pyrophosphatase YjhB (NUDIX family)
MPSNEGLFNKYLVTVAGTGAPCPNACFVIRPGHDAYSDAAARAAPGLVDRMRGRLVIQKLERWGGNARSIEDPSWPVYGAPLADAVALPIGDTVDVDPGRDMGDALGAVADPEVRRALRAYADACAVDLPALASDLRRITGDAATATPAPVQAVAGVATRRGKVLLVRTDKYGIGLPAGKVNPGESHLDALRREVLSETGLAVLRVGRFLGTDARPAFECRHYEVEVAGGDPVAGDDAVEAWWGEVKESHNPHFPMVHPMVVGALRRSAAGREGPQAAGARGPALSETELAAIEAGGVPDGQCSCGGRVVPQCQACGRATDRDDRPGARAIEDLAREVRRSWGCIRRGNDIMERTERDLYLQLLAAEADVYRLTAAMFSAGHLELERRPTPDEAAEVYARGGLIVATWHDLHFADGVVLISRDRFDAFCQMNVGPTRWLLLTDPTTTELAEVESDRQESARQAFSLTIAGRVVPMEVFQVRRKRGGVPETLWMTRTRTKDAGLASYDHHFSGNTRMEAVGWSLEQLTRADLEPSAVTWPTSLASPSETDVDGEITPA